MNKIRIFNNKLFGEIRTSTIDSMPWFIGKDICNALGYTNSTDAIQKHVDNEDKKIFLKSEFATLNIPNRGLIAINESGLYSLILSSKMKNAKKFKRWVTSEVLPSIRETGEYSLKDNHNNDLKSIMIEIYRLRKEVEALSLVLNQKEPTIHIEDVSPMSLRECAKRMGCKSSEFINWLSSNGYIEKDVNRNKWFPTTKYRDSNLFDVKQYYKTKNFSYPSQTLITNEGFKKFKKMYTEKNK